VTDSIRQQIIEAIDTRFKAILKTGAYKTDIGQHVFDWLSRDLDPAELPALIYKDISNAISVDTLVLYNNKITLEIELKAETAGTTAESLREMIEDVYKAIGTDDTWGDLAIDSEPVSEEMTMEQADKIVGSAKLTIEIEYRTPKWQY
jgi:hypothetical protein